MFQTNTPGRVQAVLDTVAVSNNRVSVLTVVGHSWAGEVKPASAGQVDRVSKLGWLTLCKVDLTVSLGVFFTQSIHSHNQTALQQSHLPRQYKIACDNRPCADTCFGDNIGLNTGRGQRTRAAPCYLDRHLDDVSVKRGHKLQLLSGSV